MVDEHVEPDPPREVVPEPGHAPGKQEAVGIVFHEGRGPLGEKEEGAIVGLPHVVLVGEVLNAGKPVVGPSWTRALGGPPQVPTAADGDERILDGAGCRRDGGGGNCEAPAPEVDAGQRTEDVGVRLVDSPAGASAQARGEVIEAVAFFMAEAVQCRPRGAIPEADVAGDGAVARIVPDEAGDEGICPGMGEDVNGIRVSVRALAVEGVGQEVPVHRGAEVTIHHGGLPVRNRREQIAEVEQAIPPGVVRVQVGARERAVAVIPGVVVASGVCHHEAVARGARGEGHRAAEAPLPRADRGLGRAALANQGALHRVDIVRHFGDGLSEAFPSLYGPDVPEQPVPHGALDDRERVQVIKRRVRVRPVEGGGRSRTSGAGEDALDERLHQELRLRRPGVGALVAPKACHEGERPLCREHGSGYDDDVALQPIEHGLEISHRVDVGDELGAPHLHALEELLKACARTPVAVIGGVDEHEGRIGRQPQRPAGVERVPQMKVSQRIAGLLHARRRPLGEGVLSIGLGERRSGEGESSGNDGSVEVHAVTTSRPPNLPGRGKCYRRSYGVTCPVTQTVRTRISCDQWPLARIMNGEVER